MSGLTREELLRASGLAAFGVLMGGCSVTGGNSHHPALARRGGDAWAWDKQLDGVTDGCTDLRVSLNGKAAKPSVSGKRFQMQAPLDRPSNAVEVSCGGSNAVQVVYTQRLTARPTARIDVAVKGGKVTLDGSSSEATEPTGAAISTWTWTPRDSNPAQLRFDGATDGPSVTLHAPHAHGEYYVTLEVADADGNTDHSTTYFVVDEHGARAVDLAHESPAWIASAVVYGVIPFLFGSPPIQAVTKRLPYLQKLGVNALWLSPITEPDVGDFGYAVTNYFKVNPNYGTADDVKQLVETAHGLGIRVLMDFVPNHSSDHHPYFVDAQKHGTSSDYYDFYDRDENGDYTYYFDWQNLPNLNYDNPEMRRFMTEAFSYWVREFDVDGFRVDACWGVRRRRPGYWAEWRAEMKRIKPDLLLLAEATGRDPWYLEHGFDVGYDWTNELGHWAWSDVFYDTPSLAQSLHDAMAADPEPAKVFRFLNNNDTGTRFVSTYDSDTTRVAATLLLTLPGIPCVYTGDEIGAQYDPYQDVQPVDWSDDHLDLRGYYTKIIHLRTSEPSLTSSAWTPLDASPKRSGLYAFLRHAPDGSDPILVVLNFAREVLEAQITLPPAFAHLSGASFRDLLTGKRAAAGGGNPLGIRITAINSLVLKPEGAAA
ncbi:MAG TPA: alpha-amylase family glycosyl hydrolase [Gaiellales bacterium]